MRRDKHRLAPGPRATITCTNFLQQKFSKAALACLEQHGAVQHLTRTTTQPTQASVPDVPLPRDVSWPPAPLLAASRGKHCRETARLTSFVFVHENRWFLGNGGLETFWANINESTVVMYNVRCRPLIVRAVLFMILRHLPLLSFLTFVFSIFSSRMPRNAPSPRPLTFKLSSQQHSTITAPRNIAFPLWRGRFEKQKIY